MLAEPVARDVAPVSRPNFGLRDEARVRNIQLNRTATITVSGIADPGKELVRVSGQLVPCPALNDFLTPPSRRFWWPAKTLRSTRQGSVSRS